MHGGINIFKDVEFGIVSQHEYKPDKTRFHADTFFDEPEFLYGWIAA